MEDPSCTKNRCCMLVIAVDVAQCYDPPVHGPVLQLDEILATSQYVVANEMAQKHQSNSSYSKQTSAAATLRTAPRHATGDVNSPDARAKSMWSTITNMCVTRQARRISTLSPRHAACCEESTGWRMENGVIHTSMVARPSLAPLSSSVWVNGICECVTCLYTPVQHVCGRDDPST